ncbi:carotenoid biosynthesis protein [Foetidibacter luteolus]|uniref:carotenoid biosynthesis protein n=1 Tax=Foetidibacter luteolus TaxID=2608880 RepID=UPI00129A4AD2|nr:carotenoid biosynthesis protein [Foetidibacter luteolus]
MKFSISRLALFIALLFHVCGLIGILFTPYKNWFISHTPLNLLLMFILVVLTQPQKNLTFFLFLTLCFITGLAAEITGVNTGLLFGSYSYTSLMGLQFKNVPLLIGANWFVTVYAAGVIMTLLDEWAVNKYREAGIKISPLYGAAAVIMDGALLATLFDWLMEPVAVQLGFWKWQNAEVPWYNYLCWYVISLLLLVIFRVLKFNKHNYFAVHLFIIQALFFLALRTFL